MTSMQLLIISDTHLPGRARDLPDELWAQVPQADVVFHAGDWVGAALLDRLTDRARRVVGVYGNNDGPDLRARLPETARVELGGLRVTVVHETGGRNNRERRMDLLYAADTDVLVFGHSHIPWDTVSPAGLRLLNPGSPTDRRRQPRCTFLTATVRDGGLHDVELAAVG